MILVVLGLVVTSTYTSTTVATDYLWKNFYNMAQADSFCVKQGINCQFVYYSSYSGQYTVGYYQYTPFNPAPRQPDPWPDDDK